MHLLRPQHERRRCNDQIDEIFPKSGVDTDGIGTEATSAIGLPKIFHREISGRIIVLLRYGDAVKSLHHCTATSSWHWTGVVNDVLS